MSRKKLHDRIVDYKNIYAAIYSMESYIFEKDLLDETDIDLYLKLTDKFNFNELDIFIKKCEVLLEEILQDPNALFEVQVYFKLKKVNEATGEIVYRPIHSASLLTQVSMVALLNIIMFDDTYSESSGAENFYSRKLSSLSNLIPSNFYGNLPSVKAEAIFQSWKHKYQEYSDAIIDKYRDYSQNKRYHFEISLDFKDFFPSINPQYIYDYIIDKLSAHYDENELDTLKMAVSKLLFCKLTNVDKDELVCKYYEKASIATNMNYTKGIPQGLPQGYFFGNLCMIELSKLISKVFEGDALYYVDDSVIYTNNGENFNEDITNLNKLINEIKWTSIKEDDFLNNINNIIAFHSDLDYKIELHPNGKSVISKLADAHWGLSQLRILAGETYNINNALFLSIDEIEDTTTEAKLKKIIEVINAELEWINKELGND